MTRKSSISHQSDSTVMQSRDLPSTFDIELTTWRCKQEAWKDILLCDAGLSQAGKVLLATCEEASSFVCMHKVCLLVDG